MTESRFTQLSQDALNGLNSTASVTLECLNEIRILKNVILIQQKRIKRLLAHYKNNPPPHPQTTLDVTATRQILP